LLGTAGAQQALAGGSVLGQSYQFPDPNVVLSRAIRQPQVRPCGSSRPMSVPRLWVHPSSSALNPDLNLWNHVIGSRHCESFRNDSAAAIRPIPGEVIRYIRRSGRWYHCGLVVCRGSFTCPNCHRDCRQDNPQHLEPNAPSQGASQFPADAPLLPPVAEPPTNKEICTTPVKLWHKHLNNRILSRLRSAFADTLRTCNAVPESNAVHQQMLMFFNCILWAPAGKLPRGTKRCQYRPQAAGQVAGGTPAAAME
jgi:hypothetical protein